MSVIPLRAMLLALLLGSGLGTFGIIAASWTVELCVAISHGGFGGVAEIRVASWGWAHPPSWIDPNLDFDTYSQLELASMALGIPSAIGFGLLGMCLWRFLVVKKFKWMTAEEVRELRKRQRQIM